MMTRTDALHEALDRMAGYNYVDGLGFACHGPMGAEALSALGHDDLVPAWVDAYMTRHPPIAAPPATDPIDPRDERNWCAALGDFARVSDWAVMFRAALWDEPWRAIVGRWVPRLLPGCGGGLTHGLLRVAHAVRAMPTDTTPSDLLLGELAKGLASWAAWYKPLPGSPTLRGRLTPDRAIARLPRPAEPWSPIEAGTFSRLQELTGYPEAVAALAPPGPLDRALSELTAATCRAILANPDAITQGPVHAVTPVAAIRALLPHIPDVPADTVYAQLWQVSAAILAGFTRPPAPGQRPRVHERTPLRPDEIIALVVEHRDPHVIKFTEACAREHSLHPDPVYLLAPQHLLDHTRPW